MSIIEYIVIGLAFGIESMIVMYRHARLGSLRLTQGLLASLIFAAIYGLLAMAGMYIGDLLHFDDMINPNSKAYVTTNVLVFIGLTAVVCIKMLLAMRNEKKDTAEVVYDLRRTSTVVALALATGVNLLILFLGVGFVDASSHSMVAAILPLFVCVFLFSYLGIMFGRQQTPLRPRRWQFIIILMLLAIAIYRGITA